MQSELDRNLRTFAIVLGLLTIMGSMMVYSSSYIYAKEVMGSSTYFISRHLMHLLFAVVLCYGVGRTDFFFWKKYAYFLNTIFGVLVLLTFIPGFGITVKGAHRWLQLGFFSLQPSELIKISVILCSITFFENFDYRGFKENAKSFCMLCLPLVLIVLLPDFGTFIICVMVIGYVAFLSCLKRKYFYSMLGTGIILGIGVLVAAPYRVQRVLTYLDPWKDPKNSGFQIIQSYLAFANGSLFGQGIGNSKEKLFYLPEAYNDFIFSVVGEELGLLGVMAIVLLYILLIYFGLKLSLSMRNRMTKIYVATCTFSIGLQAFLNMSVVLGLLPTKGLNLPLISYGGSSLVANFLAIGIMISAVRSSEAPPQTGEEETLSKAHFLLGIWPLSLLKPNSKQGASF